MKTQNQNTVDAVDTVKLRRGKVEITRPLAHYERNKEHLSKEGWILQKPEAAQPTAKKVETQDTAKS